MKGPHVQEARFSAQCPDKPTNRRPSMEVRRFAVMGTRGVSGPTRGTGVKAPTLLICGPTGEDHVSQEANYSHLQSHTHTHTHVSQQEETGPSAAPKRVLLLKLIHHTLQQISSVGELESFSMDQIHHLLNQVHQPVNQMHHLWMRWTPRRIRCITY